MSRGLLLAATIGLLGPALAGCASEQSPSGSAAPHVADERSASVGERSRRSPTGPTKLLELDSSAYAAELYPWRDEVVLVTPNGLARLGAGAAKRHAAALGFVTARQGDSIVFHRDGRLRALSIETLTERELAPLAAPPRFLFGSDTRLAWIEGDPGQTLALKTLSGGSPERVLETTEEIVVAALDDDTVYFVGRRPDGTWRIGRAPLSGSRPTYTRPRRGRFPAMLAPAADGIYYYDGPRRGVVRLSVDLAHEEPVAEPSICSPLSVSDRVVCARVGAVFDIPLEGGRRRVLAAELGGPIARLATSTDTAFWITDSGENRLTLQALALPVL